MTWEDRFYLALAEDAAVAALVGSRIFRVVAPQGTAYPLVVFRGSGGSDQHTLAGVSSLRNTRVEVEIIGETYASVKDLQTKVEAALVASDVLGASPHEPVGDYDDTLGMFFVAQDFSIWTTEE
jgi:hypothetical protein